MQHLDCDGDVLNVCPGSIPFRRGEAVSAAAQPVEFYRRESFPVLMIQYQNNGARYSQLPRNNTHQLGCVPPWCISGILTMQWLLLI